MVLTQQPLLHLTQQVYLTNQPSDVAMLSGNNMLLPTIGQPAVQCCGFDNPLSATQTNSMPTKHMLLCLLQLPWRALCCRPLLASLRCSAQAAATRQPTTDCGAACPAHLALRRLLTLLESGRTKTKCAVSCQHDFIVHSGQAEG
jgi:hypothetical protein